jgi:hypothetical protein
MKKKILLISLIFTLIAIPVSNSAVTEDEAWKPQFTYSPGFHSVTFDASIMNGAHINLPLLTANNSNDQNTDVCVGSNDPLCERDQAYHFYAFLPICTSDTQNDCVLSLGATDPNGTHSDAKFLSYTYKKHPNAYDPIPQYGVVKTETPGIWDLPSAAHSGGTNYVVAVQLEGSHFKANPTPKLDNEIISAVVLPVSLGSTRPFDTSIALGKQPNTCATTTDTNNGATRGVGCNLAMDLLPGQTGKCVYQVENTGCLIQHAFPAGYKYDLSIKLSQEPNAWLHGRITDPTISITNSNSATIIKVEAQPTKVPVYSYGGQWNSLPNQIKDYWTNCLQVKECGFTGLSHSPDPMQRYITDTLDQTGDVAIKTLKTFLVGASDTSVAVPSDWSYRTLSSWEMQSANHCFTSGDGVKGLVTTNSTTYSAGPPAFKDGTLNYVVASPHFNPDGSVFKGNYNLVIKSDVARCLYGFSKAPINATISVTSADGTPEIATTVVGEKDGWLYLKANNFEFSAPTVQVKLTQEGFVAPKSPITTKSKTTACIKGKLTKVVSTATCPVGYKKK